jgi:hypothetical protein
MMNWRTRSSLDLVPNLGKLFVAAQFLARDLGHDFFVRHAEAEVGSFAILQAKHVVAHHRPAAALLPEFARMDSRQKKFLADGVHFLADDVHDLFEGTLPEEKIRVDAGA